MLTYKKTSEKSSKCTVGATDKCLIGDGDQVGRPTEWRRDTEGASAIMHRNETWHKRE